MQYAPESFAQHSSLAGMGKVLPKLLNRIDRDVGAFKDLSDVVYLARLPRRRPADDIRKFSAVQAPTKSGRGVRIRPCNHSGSYGFCILLSSLQRSVHNDCPHTLLTAGPLS